LLQQRSKHPREMVRTPKVATSLFDCPQGQAEGSETLEVGNHNPPYLRYRRTARYGFFSLYKILFHLNALLWESIILLAPPPHLQSLPYSNTIARPLRNIRPSTDPPYACHTPYNIGDENIV